jgi:hypothetical protein
MANDVVVDGMGLSANFSEVSVGLVTRYVSEPNTLSSVEKARVETWIRKYQHVREDIAELRKRQHFFQGPQSSLSDHK